MASAGPLTLKYVFSPSIIDASVPGANPNVIDLKVMISNPTVDTVTVTKITIAIPIGEDTARNLSSIANLPSPTTDESSAGWTLTSEGDTVLLQPSTNAVGEITGQPILFTLNGIPVTTTAGIVPMTITEFPPSDRKRSDGTAYTLVKQAADLPVTAFSATPPTLYDLDQTATLSWTCSEQGKNYVYSVHSDSWCPKDCLNGGNCFTWQDGQRGVPTPPLGETTTFALDVIRSDANGQRTILQTFYTTVAVAAPSVSSASYVVSSPSGRVVWLHWLASNAAKCTVELDGIILDDNASTDTYQQGYCVVLTRAPGTHQLQVIAHAQSGSARATFSFPSISITSITIPVGHTPTGVAITPDGTLALVTNAASNDVTVVNLTTRQTEGPPIAVGCSPRAIAITPDGTLGLVTNYDDNTVTVIDIAHRKAEPATIAIVTADPQTGLGAIAVTPDGKQAVVTNQLFASAWIIDIASRQSLLSMRMGFWSGAIAITSDSRFALVILEQDRLVKVIDIATRTTEKHAIPVGQTPKAVAIMPDSSVALVANEGDSTVTVIDVAKRQASPGTIPVGRTPIAVAIAPDGTFALVVNQKDNTVTVL